MVERDSCLSKGKPKSSSLWTAGRAESPEVSMLSNFRVFSSNGLYVSVCAIAQVEATDIAKQTTHTTAKFLYLLNLLRMCKILQEYAAKLKRVGAGIENQPTILFIPNANYQLLADSSLLSSGVIAWPKLSCFKVSSESLRWSA